MANFHNALRGFLLTSTLFASAAHAENDEVLRGPAPDWVRASEPLEVSPDPRGMFFVRNQDTIVHFDESGQTFYQGSRLKLLHATALQAGNIAIGWNPAVGAPTVHKLAIHRDGETIDVLDSAEFTILRREDQLEAAMINGLLTATLQVSDLRIGDELELAYSVPANDPTLGNIDSGLLFLADAPSPGRYLLALDWDEGWEPHTRLSPEFAALAKRGDNGLRISADMPKTISPPKDAPPRYAWNRILQYSDFENWRAVSSRFDELFVTASTVTDQSAVAREANRIADRFANPMERAAAALELVQQQVRYVYVGLNEGNFTPIPAADTWQRRYGDCKAKTALLLALLDRLGIEAEAVMASNAGLDDGLDQRLPGPALFDHVLVRATIDGRKYWMDGTLPAVARPSSTPLMPYRWVLPLTKSGAELDRVDWKPSASPSEMVVWYLDAEEGFDQSANLSMTSVNTGLKGLQEYIQFSAVTEDQLTEYFRREWSGEGFWDSISDVDWSYDEDAQASILRITGTGPIEWEDRGEGKSLALPGGGFSPPGKRQRDSGQDQEAPYLNKDEFQCMLTTVRLPRDTRPENWSYNSTFETELFGRTYIRDFERTEQEVRMLRVTRVEEQEIEAARAARDNGRISDFDNSKALIEWDPEDVTSMRVGRVLPSARDFDWHEASTACAQGL